MYKVLTIAGSDCSGGAGIQADLKTFTAHKHYGMSVITALTAQNTTGVSGILDISAEFVGKQLDSVFSDIPPDAIKIGMVSAISIIEEIVSKLSTYPVQNIVVDPVMISTSGSKLLSDEAIETLKSKLFPLATIITPNLAEAACLSGLSIETKPEMVAAAAQIATFYQGYILIKGGHLSETADDLLYKDGQMTWISGERIDNPNTHGTGCTLSSAIACGLAEGLTVEASVQRAKDYITLALKAQLNLGNGSGPLNHCVL